MATLPRKNAFREEGNRLYKRAHADGNSPYVRKALLMKAIANYEKAIPAAVGDEDERASIDKNIGLAHFAVSSLESLPPMEIAERKRDALKFMVSALSRAHASSSKKDAEWSDKVNELFEKILASGVEKIEQLARQSTVVGTKKAETDSERDDSRNGHLRKDASEVTNGKDSDGIAAVSARDWVRIFYVMIEPVQPKTRLVQPYVAFAGALFRYAVRAREAGDCKDARYYLDEMALPLGEAERLDREMRPKSGLETNNNDVGGEDMLTAAYSDAAATERVEGLESEVEAEIRVTREEVEMEKSIADAMGAIQRGGELLSIAVLDDETPNMNLVFEAMDWFKSAALKTRGFDLEQEAIACHHIGRIFEKVIKLKGRAKDYYMQTKAALTRTYNKESHMTPYANDAVVKKSKKVKVDLEYETGLLGEDDEEDENVEDEEDAPVVAKAKKSTKDTGKGKTSKTSTAPAKGKGKRGK